MFVVIICRDGGNLATLVEAKENNRFTMPFYNRTIRRPIRHSKPEDVAIIVERFYYELKLLEPDEIAVQGRQVAFKNDFISFKERGNSGLIGFKRSGKWHPMTGIDSGIIEVDERAEHVTYHFATRRLMYILLPLSIIVFVFITVMLLKTHELHFLAMYPFVAIFMGLNWSIPYFRQLRVMRDILERLERDLIKRHS